MGRSYGRPQTPRLFTEELNCTYEGNKRRLFVWILLFASARALFWARGPLQSRAFSSHHRPGGSKILRPAYHRRIVTVGAFRATYKFSLITSTSSSSSSSSSDVSGNNHVYQLTTYHSVCLNASWNIFTFVYDKLEYLARRQTTLWVKNCTNLFLQYLCQTKVYFGNFWHMYTMINLEQNDTKIVNLSWIVSL